MNEKPDPIPYTKPEPISIEFMEELGLKYGGPIAKNAEKSDKVTEGERIGEEAVLRLLMEDRDNLVGMLYEAGFEELGGNFSSWELDDKSPEYIAKAIAAELNVLLPSVDRLVAALTS